MFDEVLCQSTSAYPVYLCAIFSNYRVSITGKTHTHSVDPRNSLCVQFNSIKCSITTCDTALVELSISTLDSFSPVMLQYTSRLHKSPQIMMRRGWAFMLTNTTLWFKHIIFTSVLHFILYTTSLFPSGYFLNVNLLNTYDTVWPVIFSLISVLHHYRSEYYQRLSIIKGCKDLRIKITRRPTTKTHRPIPAWLRFHI